VKGDSANWKFFEKLQSNAAMKKPRQFLPLLKQMLGFYRYGPLPLLIYLGITAAVVLVSAVFLPMEWMEAHARQKLWSDQVFVSCCASCYFLVLVSTPLPFLLLGGVTSLEFLFTRAIDRGLWLRAERAAIIIIGLGPLILNLALSPLGPQLAFEPAPSRSPAALAQERYTRIFPGSHLTQADSYGTPEQLVIPHGSEVLAAWLLWLGTLCIFLVAGYFSLAFTAWQRAGWHHSESRKRPWLGAIMVNAPVYSPILVLLCAGLRINPFEDSFLLFASHPVLMAIGLIALVLAVERLSERNIRKMEFEFS
jgi:hypothetical protein